MNQKRSKLKTFSLIFIPIIILTVFTISIDIGGKSENILTVYCSHDSVFAEKVLDKFTKETGIKIIPRYDTEASKSLGLTEKILFEKENSECDVYWSNEILSMPALKEAGLLLSYKGEGYKRIPSKYKDSEGYWCGFAARLRVVIYNTNLFNGSYKDFKNAMEKTSLNEVAIALPLYGTTLTHFAVLWENEGPETIKRRYQSWKERSIQLVPGNGPSRNLVANGTCKFGWTDTDDYFGAVDKKKPVNMFPCRLKDGSTICIPNTVGIIKHSKKIKLAQKFADFLLSEAIEIELANSSSRQIPLGKTSSNLPKEVKELMKFAEEGTDLRRTFSVRDDLISWIKEVEKLK